MTKRVRRHSKMYVLIFVVRMVGKSEQVGKLIIFWVVVSNMFCFLSLFGEDFHVD